METAKKLYQIYISQCNATSVAPDRLMGFLKERLTLEDYLNAEELLSDTLIQAEEAAFCTGCTYLPKLIKGLFED